MIVDHQKQKENLFLRGTCMKKINWNLIKVIGIAIFAMILSLSGCSSAPAAATDTRSADAAQGPTIIIYNETGFNIYYIFISLSTDTLWGDDQLGDYMLLPDGEFHAILPIIGYYDIMLVDENNDTYSFYEQPALEIETYILYVNQLDKDPVQY